MDTKVISAGHPVRCVLCHDDLAVWVCPDCGVAAHRGCWSMPHCPTCQGKLAIPPPEPDLARELLETRAELRRVEGRLEELTVRNLVKIMQLLKVAVLWSCVVATLPWALPLIQRTFFEKGAPRADVLPGRLEPEAR